jgi:membrane protease YdiL (CAAX protease family)
MPKGGARIPLLILISFGGCMLANYVCIILSTFYSSFGLSPTSSPGPEVQGVWDILARFVSTAIVPALVEELALRGVVMTPLRKYGNGFAIVFSAFVFGVFHGDMDQIPFAFICGLFMGYAVVMTESLWTGVIIHAMNNSISCIQEAIMYYTKMYYIEELHYTVKAAEEKAENAGGSFFLLLSGIAIVVGVIALIVYLKKYKAEDKPKLKSTNTLMNTTQMFKAATASPAMIASILIFCLMAVADRIPV